MKTTSAKGIQIFENCVAYDEDDCPPGFKIKHSGGYAEIVDCVSYHGPWWNRLWTWLYFQWIKIRAALRRGG